MLLELARWLSEEHIRAFAVFEYITLRAVLACATALLIGLVAGPAVIRRLTALKIGQAVRSYGPQTHLVKTGTPTMGGALILISIAVSTLLWADWTNRFVWVVLLVTFGFGWIGWVDDYRKVVHRDPEGMKSRHKFFWQALIGIVAAVYLAFAVSAPANADLWPLFTNWVSSGFTMALPERADLIVPFFKSVSYPLGVFGFVALTWFVIVGSSNAVNLTDGLDGLAIMPTVMVGSALGIFAYVVGRVDYSKYLLFPYIPGASELMVLCAAIAGAGLAFLWFNTYPAQVFMGDVGALALGGALGTIAVIVRQEIVLFIMGGVFVVETLSVMMQVAYFKYTKRRYGEGRRIFRMAPLHHHFEVGGWKETQVVVRFLDYQHDVSAGGIGNLETTVSSLVEYRFPSFLTDRTVLILGLGETGLAAALWCARAGVPLRVVDTRDNPPGWSRLKEAVDASNIEFCFGANALSESSLDLVASVVISPGLEPGSPGVAEFLAKVRQQDIEVISEIELFARALRDMSEQGYTPRVLAVTGTNGKTTVTAMTRHLMQGCGLSAVAAGNISPAALAALTAALDAEELPEVWVLELSSFQLVSTHSLRPDAAVVLNISQDHLDWHGSIQAYIQAKAKLLQWADMAVVNRDDDTVSKMVDELGALSVRSFGSDLPRFVGDLGLDVEQGVSWLLAAEPDDFEIPQSVRRRKETEKPLRKSGRVVQLMPSDALRVRGRHNAMNALAALLLARAVGLPWAPLLHAIRDYVGEPNRTEFVRSIAGVDFINDSKGTNVGATVAALEGLGQPVVLIAGGLGKGQDFSLLAKAVSRHAVGVVLIGHDAGLIQASLEGMDMPVERATDMDSAVTRAMSMAKPGHAVVLSPACASMDMFRNYAHRAQAFIDAVNSLALDHGEVA